MARSGHILGCGGNGGMQTGSGAELGRGSQVRQGCRGDGVPHGVPNVAKLAVGPCHTPLPVRLIKLYVSIRRRRAPAEHILEQAD